MVKDIVNCNRPVITAFYGGSVMILSEYVATLTYNFSYHFITWIDESRRYVNKILRPYVLLICNRIGNRFVLMRDNTHCKHHATIFKRKNYIAVLNHPATSPNLNPIEPCLRYNWSSVTKPISNFISFGRISARTLSNLT